MLYADLLVKTGWAVPGSTLPGSLSSTAVLRPVFFRFRHRWPPGYFLQIDIISVAETGSLYFVVIRGFRPGDSAGHYFNQKTRISLLIEIRLFL